MMKVSRRVRKIDVATVTFFAVAFTLEMGLQSAHANGRYPQANQLLVGRSSSDLYLRMTFGVVVSHDAGSTWNWICERAFGLSGDYDPNLALAATGTLFVATYDQVERSENGGCDFVKAPEPLGSSSVVDFVVRPNAPSEMFALVSKDTGYDAMGRTYASRVYLSKDRGNTWNAFAPPIDAHVKVETLEVSATDPNLLFVSGERRFLTSSVSGVFLVSSAAVDSGNWNERSIPFEANDDKQVFIAGVDPSDAKRVYVRTLAVNGSRLLVTDDTGATFRVAFQAQSQLRGFALSSDGSKIFTGGPLDGIWSASKTDLVFERRSNVPAQCLATSGSSLFACADDVSGFSLGVSTDDGASFTSVMRFADIRGAVECSGTASAAQCATEWPSLRAQLQSVADGGVLDDEPNTEEPAPAKSSGCSGCAVDRPEMRAWASTGTCAAGAAFVVAIRARRRRATRKRDRR